MKEIKSYCPYCDKIFKDVNTHICNEHFSPGKNCNGIYENKTIIIKKR